MVATGLRTVGSDVELRNQLEFQKNRCEGLATMLADSAKAAVADSLARARADSIARSKPGKRSPSRPSEPGKRSTSRPSEPGKRSTSRPSAPLPLRPSYYVQIVAV